MLNTSIDKVSRRSASRLILGLAGAVALSEPMVVMADSSKNQVRVWKTPNCGCCSEWVTHLRSSGFEVVTYDVNDTGPIRQKLGLAEKYGSCHTGKLGDYSLEGHVPAKEMQRLLREKPTALGLAVPGMPVGSPGMEMGKNRDAYDVLLILKNGSFRVYQSYPKIS
jgi:hypothetical protein